MSTTDRFSNILKKSVFACLFLLMFPFSSTSELPSMLLSLLPSVSGGAVPKGSSYWNCWTTVDLLHPLVLNQECQWWWDSKDWRSPVWVWMLFWHWLFSHICCQWFWGKYDMVNIKINLVHSFLHRLERLQSSGLGLEEKCLLMQTPFLISVKI